MTIHAKSRTVINRGYALNYGLDHLVVMLNSIQHLYNDFFVLWIPDQVRNDKKCVSSIVNL